MATLNSTIHPGKSSAARAAIAAGLVIAALLFSLVIIELAFRFVPVAGRQLYVDRQIYDWDRQITFFHGAGAIFQNRGPIFTYVPHDNIRSMAVYFSDRDFVTEYDYRFHTNNLGLVEDYDIQPARPSLLLLGDSYTEGHGAEPWFRQLAAQNGELPYQLINGGLRGTGFAQWSLLEGYLQSANVNVQKLIVLFISDDYSRPVANVSDEAQRCLETQLVTSCPDESIYRLPPAEDLPQRVDQIRSMRTDGAGVADRLVKRVGKLLPATRRFYKVLKRIVMVKMAPAGYAARRGSRAAITGFIKEHGAANVAFMHLPQKSEIVGPPDEAHAPNGFGLQARQDIGDAGGKLYDGFKLCGLTPDDYYVHDGHPNKRGYAKIARCVGEVVRDLTAADGHPEARVAGVHEH